MKNLALTLAIILSAGLGHAYAQTTTLTFTNRSRPVLRAVLSLTAQYGYVITYEEPKYLDPDDLKDITSLRHDLSDYAPGHAPKVLIPAGGSLVLPLPAGRKITQQAMYELLQQLVGTWTSSSQGGAHYAVEEDGAVFHIVPTEVRDKNGNWQAVESMLQAPISVPALPRTRDEIFDAICGTVGATAGIRVNCLPEGEILVGLPQTPEYSFGASQEPAVSVLTRAINLTGAAGWYLLYDPTSHAYFMNILRAPGSAPNPPAAPPTPNCCIPLTPPASAPSG